MKEDFYLGDFPDIPEYPPDSNLLLLLAIRAIYDVLVDIRVAVNAIEKNR